MMLRKEVGERGGERSWGDAEGEEFDELRPIRPAILALGLALLRPLLALGMPAPFGAYLFVAYGVFEEFEDRKADKLFEWLERIMPGVMEGRLEG